MILTLMIMMILIMTATFSDSCERQKKTYNNNVISNYNITIDGKRHKGTGALTTAARVAVAVA